MQRRKKLCEELCVSNTEMHAHSDSRKFFQSRRLDEFRIKICASSAFSHFTTKMLHVDILPAEVAQWFVAPLSHNWHTQHVNENKLLSACSSGSSRKWVTIDRVNIGQLLTAKELSLGLYEPIALDSNMQKELFCAFQHSHMFDLNLMPVISGIWCIMKPIQFLITFLILDPIPIFSTQFLFHPVLSHCKSKSCHFSCCNNRDH